MGLYVAPFYGLNSRFAEKTDRNYYSKLSESTFIYFPRLFSSPADVPRRSTGWGKKHAADKNATSELAVTRLCCQTHVNTRPTTPKSSLQSLVRSLA